MTEEVSARATTPNSADLIMTKEYLVVKGKHYRVSNGYLYSSSQTQAVAIKDILAMEYQTIRAKRMLIAFMILMTIVVFGGVGVHRMLSVTRQIDREVQKVENVYNYIADENIDISVTSCIKNGLSELGIKGIITLYIILIIGSGMCCLLYLLKPFHVLYISTLGKIIAVEKRFYNKAELDAIVKAWKMQLQ